MENKTLLGIPIKYDNKLKPIKIEFGDHSVLGGYLISEKIYKKMFSCDIKWQTYRMLCNVL